MKSKTEQKPETKTGEARESEIDIQEIGPDEACDVVGGLGGSCAGCNSCGGSCSCAGSPPPVLNQM